jgi:hypothetical protein
MIMPQIDWTALLIMVAVAAVVAIAIRIFRARAEARNRGPIHIHEPLIKRAEAFTDRSAFLKKVCREFKLNGHISDRQAEAVKKAVARFEGQ